LLYYKEGPDATVAVRRKRNSVSSQRTLIINGKADASSAGDMPTQILLAQLPMALNRQTESVLAIGLGSGITAGSLATNESLKNLTILEISNQVVEASSFFEPENYAVLSDPRVNLVTADARNFLMASPEHYDLIISEPSNPWISGIANLFTDEFLKLAKSRLNVDGVMTQWFHTYSMSGADLKTMLKTFDENFGYVSVWRIQEGDLALIGSDQPHAISLAYATQKGAKEFSRAQINSDRDLAGLYIFGGDVLSRYVRDSKINSDNRPIVEFNAPKNLYSLTKIRNMNSIFDYLQGGQQAVPLVDMVIESDGYLDVPFMTLRIDDKGNDMDQLSTNWLIDRPRVQVNGESMAGLGSERLLAWKEGSSRFQIRAVLLSSATRQQSLQNLLDQLTRSTGRPGGKVKLANDIDAIWLSTVGVSNSSGDHGSLQLDIAWDCPLPDSGFTRYALQANLPDPGQEAGPDVLARLAGRFSCYSAD
jgi:spermidine synthase